MTIGRRDSTGHLLVPWEAASQYPSLVSFFVECRNFDLTTVRLEEWSIIVRLVQRPDMVVTMRKYFESISFLCVQ